MSSCEYLQLITYNLLLITYYLQLHRWVYSQPVFVFDFANKAPLLMGQRYIKIDIFVCNKRGIIKSVLIRLKPEWGIPVISSVLLTLYFFYIDEAKYSFNGFFEFTNLIFLGVYVFILIVIQKLIQLGLVYFKFSNIKSLISNSMVSTIVLLGLLFILFIMFP